MVLARSISRLAGSGLLFIVLVIAVDRRRAASSVVTEA
jgi:hypothetical protein